MKAKSIFSKLIAGVAAAAMVAGMMPGMSMTAKAAVTTLHTKTAADAEATDHFQWYDEDGTTALTDPKSEAHDPTNAAHWPIKKVLKASKGYRFSDAVNNAPNLQSATFIGIAEDASAEVTTPNLSTDIFSVTKQSETEIEVSIPAGSIGATSAHLTFIAGSGITAVAEKIDIDVKTATGIKDVTSVKVAGATKSYDGQYLYKEAAVFGNNTQPVVVTYSLEDNYVLKAGSAKATYAGDTTVELTATVNPTAKTVTITDAEIANKITAAAFKKGTPIVITVEAEKEKIDVVNNTTASTVKSGSDSVAVGETKKIAVKGEEFAFTLDPEPESGKKVTYTLSGGKPKIIESPYSIPASEITAAVTSITIGEMAGGPAGVSEAAGATNYNVKDAKTGKDAPTTTNKEPFATLGEDYTFQVEALNDYIFNENFEVTLTIGGTASDVKFVANSKVNKDTPKTTIGVDISASPVECTIPKDYVTGDIVITVAPAGLTAPGAQRTIANTAEDEGVGSVKDQDTGTTITAEGTKVPQTQRKLEIVPAAGWMIPKEGVKVTYVSGGVETEVTVLPGGTLNIPANANDYTITKIEGMVEDPNYTPGVADPNAFKDVDAEKPEKPGTSAPESTGDRGSSKAPVFTDLVPGSVHNDDISRAAQLGLIKGVGNGQFNPLGILSRAEAATLIHRALGTPAPTKTVSKFVDVVAPLHGDHINAILYHEAQTPPIVKGITETRFEPYWNVTRAMFVTFIWRAAGEPAGADSKFADLSADWYKTAVNWAAAQGIVKGYSDTSFGPNDVITREQAASILVRAYDKGVFGKASAAPATTDETKTDETKTDESKTDGAADGEKTDAATEGEKTESDAA